MAAMAAHAPEGAGGADGATRTAPRRRAPWLGVKRQSSHFRPSRTVLALKAVLPSLALALLALVLIWPQIVNETSRFALGLTAVGPVGSAKPQVLNPRLVGVDENARPFVITAEMGSTRAGEGGKDLYVLSRPNAEMTLDDGSRVTLVAEDGVFEQTAKRLVLSGNVVLSNDAGYEFTTEQIVVLLSERIAESESAVHGQGPAGEITSQGLRITEGGERIVFTGKARLTLRDTAKPPGF